MGNYLSLLLEDKYKVVELSSTVLWFRKSVLKFTLSRVYRLYLSSIDIVIKVIKISRIDEFYKENSSIGVS